MTTDVFRLPARVSTADHVAVEEPLEIRVGGVPIAVTMRTPGHDEELALGFCLSEGIRAHDARPTSDFAANTVEVDAEGFDVDVIRRNFYTSSSCGVTARSGPTAFRSRCNPPATVGITI